MAERESARWRDACDADPGYTSPPTGDKLLKQLLEWLERDSEYREHFPITSRDVLGAHYYLQACARQFNLRIADDTWVVPIVLRPDTAIAVYALGVNMDDIGIVYFDHTEDRENLEGIPVPAAMYATCTPGAEGFLNPVDSFPCTTDVPRLLAVYRGI